MKRIGIDIGHDVDERGSTQYDGESEIAFTRPLGLAVKRELEENYECEVFLIHDGEGVVPGTDPAAELKERGRIANSLYLDFLLSLHHNAGPQAARGAEFYIWTNKRAANGDLVWLIADGNHSAPNSYAIAKKMQLILRDCLAEKGIPWRGSPDRIMCADFAILRYPNLPCALLETHFGTNPQEDAIADSPDFIPHLARGIARALSVGLDLPRKRKKGEVLVEIGGEAVECAALIEEGKTRLEGRPLLDALVGKKVTRWTWDADRTALVIETE